MASMINATTNPASSDSFFDAILDYQSNTGGFVVAAVTIAYTAVLELFSLAHVKKVLEQPSGRKLYQTAILYNLINNMVLGPVIWYVAVDLLCRPPLPAFECAWKTFALLGIHSAGYYCAHAAMHRPELYRYHKLHHRFHTHVTPVAAVCIRRSGRNHMISLRALHAALSCHAHRTA